MTTEKPDKPFEDECLALAFLLQQGVIFLNNGKFGDSSTTCCFVGCNDCFAWACSDAESILSTDGDLPSPILDLAEMVRQDEIFGSTRWVCIERNEKPQRPLADMMRRAGKWDDVMEALPANHYDEYWRKKHEEKNAVE